MKWHPTPVLLPGKSRERRSLLGCSPWGREESDMTERLHFHFSLSCIGEGNSNPFQCSCLENPRDGGAWWAAVYGVTQSRTRLKQLSSSSSSKWNMQIPVLIEKFLFLRINSSRNSPILSLSHSVSLSLPTYLSSYFSSLTIYPKWLPQQFSCFKDQRTFLREIGPF